jgi:hypothetical protein
MLIGSCSPLFSPNSLLITFFPTPASLKPQSRQVFPLSTLHSYSFFPCSLLSAHRSLLIFSSLRLCAFAPLREILFVCSLPHLQMTTGIYQHGQVPTCSCIIPPPDTRYTAPHTLSPLILHYYISDINSSMVMPASVIRHRSVPRLTSLPL